MRVNTLRACVDIRVLTRALSCVNTNFFTPISRVDTHVLTRSQARVDTPPERVNTPPERVDRRVLTRTRVNTLP